MSKFVLCGTEEYAEWFEEESEKSKYQIQGRLLNIEIHGHFGALRNLKEKLSELKFNDGKRIYYTIIPENNVILLLGGNKNGQKKDIKKARTILKREQKNKN